MRYSLFLVSVLVCSAQTKSGIDETARTIVAKSCGGCHGAPRMGGLDLRERETALRGGKRGPALVPGKAEQSLIYSAIARTGELAMPPGNKGLSPSEIDVIREWINAGAKWPARPASAESAWWSFRKLQRPDVPKNAATKPIDAFIQAKLDQKGLHSSPPADRRTLIRRATFDLHGLPPTPEEIQQFVADPAPDAYPKLIDRLLASKRYGERWGRHWLDVVRYADTGGFETDIYFPNAWRYRDYVIQSLNDDKPFNRFVQEQVAGDELWPDDLDLDGGFEIPKEKQQHLQARIGTGMYTIGPVYHEAALFGGQVRYEWLTDVVDTTGEAFLGITLGCARCHNHKFDPLTQRDYHAMMAVFAGSEEREVPVVSRFSIFGFKSGYPNYLRVEELKAAVGRIDAVAHKRIVDQVRARFSADVLAAYDVAPEKRTPAQKTMAVTLEKALTDSGLKENAKGMVADLSYTDAEHKERERLIHELGQASLKANPVLQTATVLGHADVVPAVYMTSRGDWRSKGEKVGPAFPAILSGGQKIEEPENEPLLLQRRKALALWLTQPDHPLTARVIVNRLWQGHFGRGIVGTPNDFGRQGEPPTHPELLDWLASEFVSKGWSLKTLHKEMMLSDAYQRSSQFAEANARVDADNRLLWRMSRQRMDAETLRDSVLAASGKLNLKMGGKPVIPSLSKEEYSVLWARNQWPESLDPEEQNRRSVYLYVKRQFPIPMLSTFDEPDTSVSCGRRDNTTVAPQALTMMNGDFMVQQARYLAARLKKEYGGKAEDMVRGAWQLAFGRAPSAAEAAKASGANLEQLCLILLNTNEFLYID